jgi:hypothetical protein
MPDDTTGNYIENFWERERLENTRRWQDNIKNAVNKLHELTWYGFIWLKEGTDGGRL